MSAWDVREVVVSKAKLEDAKVKARRFIDANTQESMKLAVGVLHANMLQVMRPVGGRGDRENAHVGAGYIYIYIRHGWQSR